MVHHRSRRRRGRTKYSAGSAPVNDWIVESCGRVAGHVHVDLEGWYRIYDIGWSPLGVHATAARALHAIDQHTLLSIYGTTIEALRAELRRGIVALDQEAANELRLARLTSEDIRVLSAELLADGWNKRDLAVLIARWRKLREEDTP